MTIKECIVANPLLSNRQIADMTGTSEGSVATQRTHLKHWQEKTGSSGAPVKAIHQWGTQESKEEAVKPEPSPLKQSIKEALKKKDVQNVYVLADLLDASPKKIQAAIDELISEGHTIKIDNGNVLFSKIIPKSPPRVLDVSKMSTGFYKFGVTSDNHLCSRYERLDVLHSLYDIFEREGITKVLNGGNWIDGEARFNKHDLLEHGMDNQINYFLNNYPHRDGIETHLITGDDHEGWYTQREGVDVGSYMQMKARKAGREDLFHLGHMEADIILKAPKGHTTMRVLHPGGGSSYATSYTAQKIVESYTGGEKPNILLVAHYHKAEYLFNRGVHIVQTGTTMDQSPFMRKKRLAAHVGGWIIEFSVDDFGAVTRFKQEFFPYYDNEYYSKWSYKM